MRLITLFTLFVTVSNSLHSQFACVSIIDEIDHDQQALIHIDENNNYYLISESTAFKYNSQFVLAEEKEVIGHHFGFSDSYFFSVQNENLLFHSSLYQYDLNYNLIQSDPIVNRGRIDDFVAIDDYYVLLLRYDHILDQTYLEKFDASGTLIQQIALQATREFPDKIEVSSEGWFFLYNDLEKDNYWIFDEELNQVLRMSFPQYQIKSIEVVEDVVYFAGPDRNSDNFVITKLNRNGIFLDQLVLIPDSNENQNEESNHSFDLIRTQDKLVLSVSQTSRNSYVHKYCLSLDLEVEQTHIFNNFETSDPEPFAGSNLVLGRNNSVVFLHNIMSPFGVKVSKLSSINSNCKVASCQIGGKKDLEFISIITMEDQDEWSAALSSISESEVENSPSKYSVFPNPFDNNIYISKPSDSSKTTEVRICDLYGRMVYSQEVEANKELYSCDLSNLHAGMYTVQLKQGSELEVFQIIKN